MDWTTQAVGQQHTSPLRARCEARRREVVICGCGNGLARDAPVDSKVDDGLRAGGPQGLQAAPGGGTRPRANHRPRVYDGRDPAEVRCIQPLEGVGLMNINARSAGPPSCFLLASRNPVSCNSEKTRFSDAPHALPRAGPAAAADLVGLAHQCYSSVLQEPFGRASRVGAPRASSDAPISPP